VAPTTPLITGRFDTLTDEADNAHTAVTGAASDKATTATSTPREDFPNISCHTSPAHNTQTTLMRPTKIRTIKIRTIKTALILG
jgi:hypothetical protein